MYKRQPGRGTFRGDWFSKTKKREKVVLATKIAGPGSYTAHIRSSGFSPKSIENALIGVESEMTLMFGGFGLSGIPEKAIPIVPDPWRTVNTESISYGYGLSVSPLHLAVATSAVVNGGYLIKPSLTKLGDDKRYENQIFSEETSEIMRYLLSQVVAKGTAKEAFNKDADKAYIEDGKFKYLVGGKTGTSHKTDKKSYTREKLTTFISVLPIHKPKYVVVLVLDNPKGITSFKTPVIPPIIANLPILVNC